MDLPKTSLNVVYIEPQEVRAENEEKDRLLNFITLFAQVGFKEYSLNGNSRIDFEFT